MLIKNSLFWWPLGAIIRLCGGVAVDRQTPTALVRHIRRLFASRDELALLFTPEGTRAPQKNWKPGFYHVAVAADVPIVVSFVHAGKRHVGVAHVFTPSGDLAADMAQIKAFYDTQQGLRPENYAS